MRRTRSTAEEPLNEQDSRWTLRVRCPGVVTKQAAQGQASTNHRDAGRRDVSEDITHITSKKLQNHYAMLSLYFQDYDFAGSTSRTA